jgi:hypothetical protein
MHIVTILKINTCENAKLSIIIFTDSKHKQNKYMLRIMTGHTRDTWALRKILFVQYILDENMDI